MSKRNAAGLPEPFFSSREQRRTIVYDEAAPCVMWMTRRDLHAWVWSQPVADVSEMVGIAGSVGWHCWIYDVCRPRSGGYFHKLRAGKPVEIDPLDSSRDPDEPVPLADFDQDGCDFTLRCSPNFSPETQLGPPDQEGRIYPRPAGALPLAAPRALNPLQRVRFSGLDIGPPKPLTRGMLSRIAWGSRDAVDLKTLEIYGLDAPALAVLIEREGIASLPPIRNWTWFEWDAFARYHRQTKRRRLTPQQWAQRVDLSPAARAEISAILEREADVRKDRANRARQTVAARYTDALERLPAIMSRFAAGERLDVIIPEEGAQVSGVTGVIRDLLKGKLPHSYTRMTRRISAAIAAGVDVAPTDRLLLTHVCGEPHPLRFKNVTSARHSTGPDDGLHLVRLALWIASAAEVEEAGRSLEEALDECRAHLASKDTYVRFRPAL